MTDFLRLPVNPDEGFPQAFRLSLGGRTYQFALHVNVAEEVLPEPGEVAGQILELGDPEVDRSGAFLVVAVSREDAGGAVPLLRRKVVPGLEYLTGDLVLTFRSLRVALKNLNGVGAFGSEIVAGVALR